jgi:hypothetical protein
MAVAARESRRALALDVRAMVWQGKRFDVGRFLRTGQLIEWGKYDLPDTPAMREAREDVEREREMHRLAGRG